MESRQATKRTVIKTGDAEVEELKHSCISSGWPRRSQNMSGSSGSTDLMIYLMDSIRTELTTSSPYQYRINHNTTSSSTHAPNLIPNLAFPGTEVPNSRVHEENMVKLFVLWGLSRTYSVRMYQVIFHVPSGREGQVAAALRQCVGMVVPAVD